MRRFSNTSGHVDGPQRSSSRIEVRGRRTTQRIDVSIVYVAIAVCRSVCCTMAPRVDVSVLEDNDGYRLSTPIYQEREEHRRYAVVDSLCE